MCGTSLQETELYSPCLKSETILDLRSKISRKTSELNMSETVRCRCGNLGDEASVGIMNTLGYRYIAVAVLLIAALDIGYKLIHIKISLRKIDIIEAMSVYIGKCGSRGKPSRMSSHALKYCYRTLFIYGSISCNFHDGCCDILCR